MNIFLTVRVYNIISFIRDTWFIFVLSSNQQIVVSQLICQQLRHENQVNLHFEITDKTKIKLIANLKYYNAKSYYIS